MIFKGISFRNVFKLFFQCNFCLVIKMFEKLTRPDELNDSRLLLLVHTFLYPYGFPSQDELSRRLDLLQDRRHKYHASIVQKYHLDRYDQRDLEEFPRVDQVDTYGEFGVALLPREEDLLIAWDSDVFSPSMGGSESEMRSFFGKYSKKKIRPLGSLLRCGYYAPLKMGYNDIVLKGRKENFPYAIVYHPTEEGLRGRDALSKLLPDSPAIDLGISWKENVECEVKRKKLEKMYLNSVREFCDDNLGYLLSK